MPSPTLTPRTRPAPAGRRRPNVAKAGPEVPLWLVCPRAHWRRCEQRGRIAPAAASVVAGPGLRVALHADVGESALRTFGPCRSDLVAVALDPRKLPGRGPGTSVRVDLNSAGLRTIWIDRATLPLGVAVAVESLRPLADEAGYHAPALETDADRERARNRDGLRRTR